MLEQLKEQAQFVEQLIAATTVGASAYIAVGTAVAITAAVNFAATMG